MASKLINNPDKIVEELIEGCICINKDKLKSIKEKNIIARIDTPIKGKVGIIIGCGSGHEPLPAEFVGEGMADAAVCGQIFAAPSVSQYLAAIKAVDSGEGIILLINNYTGDMINSKMAIDLAREEGLLVDRVIIHDEISSAPIGKREERRGTTANHLITKIAGASSGEHLKFNDLIELVKRAEYNCRSLGVSLSACTRPGTTKPTFDLEMGKMEFGMGLHGEVGIKRIDLMSADETTKTILDILIKDLPYKNGDEIVVIVNGYGSTTRMEMLIISRYIYSYMKDLGIKIHATEVGEFCTSQEMAGVSITLMKLDEELKLFYDMKAISPGYIKV